MTHGLGAALVSGGFGLVIFLLGIFARLNKRDHDVNTGKLDELLRGHERIETKIDGHIGDHARGEL
jgi:hypothetical protein